MAYSVEITDPAMDDIADAVAFIAERSQPATRNHPDDRSRIEAGNTITLLYYGAIRQVQTRFPSADIARRDWCPEVVYE